MNNQNNTQQDASEIQEQIFDLRNEQANCSADERPAIQEQIEDLYRVMDGQK